MYFDLLIANMTMKIDVNDMFAVKTQNILVWEKSFQTKLVVFVQTSSDGRMNNWILFVWKELASLVCVFYALYDFVIHWCEFNFDLWSSLRSEQSSLGSGF